VRYAVVLDYGEDGMYRDYVVETFDDRGDADDYAEAFTVGCMLGCLPNGERGTKAIWRDGAWSIERSGGHPPAIVRVEEWT
jgi:hypothetical protein